MLGDSSVLGSSLRHDVTTAVVAPPEGRGGDGSGGGGVGSNNSGEETFRGGGGEDLLGSSGERSFGGNRWPRQETIALLQIRSDMDVIFRDASVKGPLWEEVSRKLAALGYHRSGKKCKEKFENVYKYHRRTKEGRTGKSDGKTYRFFDQLNAFENQPPTPGTTHPPHQPNPRQSSIAAAAVTMAVAPGSNPPPTMSHTSTTVPSSAAPHPIITAVSSSQGIATPALNNLNSFPPTNPIVLPPQPQPPPPTTTTNPTNNPDPNTFSRHHHHNNAFPSSFPSISTDLLSNSTSSSTSSDEELEGRAKKKRKWKDFFDRLMREVIQKQEDLQKRFLEAIEKRERERMVREEAWRMQEMQRMNREREILAQERSITAAKDTAVMSFLQKISEQQQNPNQNQNPPVQSQTNNNLLQLQPQPLPPPPRQPAPPPPPPQPQQPGTNFDTFPKANNNEENNNSMSPASSSRWPKVEVEALIKLRTNLDSKYQENGPKGPLWEEISGEMRKLGYNRNAKRCKEKWENINKYFKKVKESNKRRPEDSKTCPYFHLLDSLYRERNKFDQNNVTSTTTNTTNSSNQFKPENTVPLMVRPEQQWPPQQQILQDVHVEGDGLMDIDHHHHQNQEDHDHQDKENIGDEDDDDDDDDDDDVDDEEDEEEDEGNYEIVANKPAPVGAAAAE